MSLLRPNHVVWLDAYQPHFRTIPIENRWTYQLWLWFQVYQSTKSLWSMASVRFADKTWIIWWIRVSFRRMVYRSSGRWLQWRSVLFSSFVAIYLFALAIFPLLLQMFVCDYRKLYSVLHQLNSQTKNDNLALLKCSNCISILTLHVREKIKDVSIANDSEFEFFGLGSWNSVIELIDFNGFYWE